MVSRISLQSKTSVGGRGHASADVSSSRVNIDLAQRASSIAGSLEHTHWSNIHTYDMLTIQAPFLKQTGTHGYPRRKKNTSKRNMVVYTFWKVSQALKRRQGREKKHCLEAKHG